MNRQQIQIFEASKMTLAEAVDESIASLREYGSRFPYWVAAFSGGKDSSATTILTAWAIKTGQVKAPETFTILYSNTRMELVPLYNGAIAQLEQFKQDSFITKIVEPVLDDRVFVAILGRGLPPFNNNRRGCTRLLKGDPMTRAISDLQNIDKTLFITGIRFGESRSRDQRISVSCSRESGECGQGWFQNQFNNWGVASLAPIVHWRLCNVFDWLYFERDKHGYNTDGILEVYGEDDIRTGCMACFVVEEDKPLLKMSRKPEWSHLSVILELNDVYRWLSRHENRLRKPLTFTKAGSIHNKSGVIGPLTIEARREGLRRILDIQNRAGIVLIDDKELKRIYWHWGNETFPLGWTGQEPLASELTPCIQVLPNGQDYTIQYILPHLVSGAEAAR